ncbi:hypothetical protein TVNIR_0564 [Thioalkalivibrio nitratireducens DSM 14787]|uniref:Uncharacterized protein n=1 Tax=Thioalkalivibrio nitratireducens (strain DSM 14787 / UNIQEM 213 / ALEN2) TaxID=1255043 RepID=L0DV69_THIND|nr:hypothetical protein TVNIR_0564 [Thioalkalivibrio nitratireducens DSM 14787]
MRHARISLAPTSGSFTLTIIAMPAHAFPGGGNGEARSRADRRWQE